jgi:UDP-N-acetyl-D-mannosaminuronic acid transferase (WecB/TagA/CpsF family)
VVDIISGPEFDNNHPLALESDSFSILGVPVSVTSLPEATQQILNWGKDRRGRFVCVRDCHGLMQAYENE